MLISWPKIRLKRGIHLKERERDEEIIMIDKLEKFWIPIPN